MSASSYPIIVVQTGKMCLILILNPSLLWHVIQTSHKFDSLKATTIKLLAGPPLWPLYYPLILEYLAVKF